MKSRKDNRGSFHFRDPNNSPKMLRLFNRLYRLWDRDKKLTGAQIQDMGFLNPAGAISELRAACRKAKTRWIILPAEYAGLTANGSKIYRYGLERRSDDPT